MHVPDRLRRALVRPGRASTSRQPPNRAIKHVHFIYAGGAHGGAAFALRVLDNSGESTGYYSFDHLGSITAMSDDQGHVSVTGTDPTVFGYDSWGARRNPDGTLHRQNPSISR